MFSRKETNRVNQTEFLDQAQFLEKQTFDSFNLKNLKNNKSLIPFYVLGLIFLFLLLLMIFKVVFNKQVPETEQVKEVRENVELAPLNLRVNELRENLKDHNPTKQTLPFPQVDLEFNIN